MAEQSGNPRIVVLAGDGIGPEIVGAARLLLDRIGTFDYEEQLIGGASIDELGSPLSADALTACRAADAVLLGAVGGPKWDTTDPDAPRPEQGLLGLRKGLGLYANLRPVKPLDALIDASPLRRERIEGTDLLVVRELTGGIYFGRKDRQPDSALDECVYTSAEVDPDRPYGLRGRRAPGRRRRRGAGHIGRQGQRARDLTPVARGDHADWPANTRKSPSTTCSSTTPPCSSSPTPRSST